MPRNDNHIDADKLIQDCIRGKDTAQRTLYSQYAKSMYHTIVRMMPYKAEADDLLQESFIKVFQNLESFRGEASLGAWIKRICVNTTLKALRKRSPMHFVDPQDLPEEIVEVEEKFPLDVKIIHEHIKLLPEGSRVILNLHLMEGYKHREIAGMLNISESTSKSQYHRAKSLLRKALTKRLNYEG